MREPTFVATDIPRPKDPTINFAIGPSCPVRCEGCYNQFGDTFGTGELVKAEDVIDFAAAAHAAKFATAAQANTKFQATVSGGDPLFHPEIVPIIQGFKDLNMKVKMDTVGTALLEDARIVFKGRGTAKKVDIQDIAPYVDFINVPLDGARQDTIESFRRGRRNLFTETITVAGLLRDAGVSFGFNTVANTSNVDELAEIRDIAEEVGASEWQVFEYDPNGPNPTNKKDTLRLAPGQFDQATAGLASTSGNLQVVCKSLDTRNGIYFLIDDSGHAWKPAGEGIRTVFGHITRERDVVMNALGDHIRELRRAELPQTELLVAA